MKPRLVMDTSVLVSGIFFAKGNEAQILSYAIEGRAVLLASLDTLEELREVLTRPKFQLTQPEALTLFQMVLSRCEIVLNPEKAEAKCRDPDDQKFLDCAVAGKADHLVTGDPDLLVMERAGRTMILTGAQLVKVLRKTWSTPPKLSDIAGSKRISKEDWLRTRGIIRNSETEAREG
ncbi:putative toxin-antitoxin system toxin component, PIN family [Candidatus Bathyarchaeota archaeon]|nr:MAG: putative toxin-antitoxin system toxin component, PIN family [Candidatus Bathyarchaeota archaeon]